MLSATIDASGNWGVSLRVTLTSGPSSSSAAAALGTAVPPARAHTRHAAAAIERGSTSPQGQARFISFLMRDREAGPASQAEELTSLHRLAPGWRSQAVNIGAD